jgi:hypothetical protein
MPGLKKHEPSFRFSANKVSADEMDRRERYMVVQPTVSLTWFATAIGTGNNTVVTGGLTNQQADYPRTVLLAITGVAGGIGGTSVVTGTNQFGDEQTETIGFGSAAAGGTIAGTKIFDTVTSHSTTLQAIGGTGVGTVSLGVAVGTAANQEAWFGLPVRIKSVSDVKKIMWNDAGTMKTVNGGTVTSTYVDVDNHSFRVNEVVAAADSYNVEVISTYDSSNNSNMS